MTKWERRFDEKTESAWNHPVKAFFAVVGVVLAVAAVFAVIGLAAGWFSGTANLASFEHSKTQTTAVLDDWTRMEATAGNVCGITEGARSDDDPTLVEDPSFAYSATYRSIKADYDRRMNNLFEAAVTRQLPLPAAIRGYPKIAPTLKEMQAQVC